MKTTEKAVSVKIDYLTIIFEKANAFDIIHKLLKLPEFLFCKSKGQKDYKDYTQRYKTGSITIFSDALPSTKNPMGNGSCLELSGSGCDSLRMYLRAQKKDFSDFFRDCVELFGEENFHLTRLDVAIDDRNEVPYFTIEQIQRKCIKNEFVSRSQKYDFRESSFENYPTAKTVYIGAKDSDVRYRLYDKDKEQAGMRNIPLEQIGNWKRTEIQLRNKPAHLFAMHMKESPDSLEQVAFDYLGSHLRFIISDENETNRSRLKTCQFWQRFLGDIKTLHLKVKYEINSLYDTQEWLEKGGGLSALKAFIILKQYGALGDLKDMEKLMEGVKFSHELGMKLVTHLTQIHREDLIPLIYQETKKIEPLNEIDYLEKSS